MKIPKEIKILGIPWKITVTNTISAVNPYANQRLWGICLHEDKEIIITKQSGRESLEKTFIHEVLHAIIGESGLEFDRDREEDIVNRLTDGIYSILVHK